MDWILENLIEEESDKDVFEPLPLYIDLYDEYFDYEEKESEEEKSSVIIIDI